jgi:5'-nucleotidase
MRIVLTNDDGIDAPGLLAARQALERVGDVMTVAPDRNRSGVGRSISFGRSLRVEEVEMADGRKATPARGHRWTACGSWHWVSWTSNPTSSSPA